MIQSERAPKIEVFIVEDHPDLRETLCLYFEMQADMNLCGIAGSSEEALALLEHLAPNVALIDHTLPGLSGIELVSRIRKEHPEVICLVISGHLDPTVGKAAANAGASGYVIKGRTKDIAECVRLAVAGETLFPTEVDLE